MPRGAEAGDDSEHRRAVLGAVIEDRERQLESVGALADGEDLLARLSQRAPGAFGERLAAKRRKRLRRSEPLGRAADEQDARCGYAIRHCSV